MHSRTPKRGAAFVVDGRHFHAITPPREHSVRSVINANLLVEMIEPMELEKSGGWDE